LEKENKNNDNESVERERERTWQKGESKGLAKI